MKKVKRGLLYFFMLEKRFFKKPAFLLLLFTIPLLAFCLKNVSGEESGILSIGLYQEEPEDDAVQEVIEALLQKESVIHFERVESEESGRERVQKRELDALWIFREDFQDKIEGILTGEEGEAPILSVEQEDTVVLQLSRVKLFGEAYGNVAYPIYRNFVHQYWGESVSEEELQRIFAEGSGMQKMFYTVYEKVGTDRPEQHYMTAPLRGMLALWILLAGLAANLFFLRDVADGVMDAVPGRKSEMQSWGYEFAAMLPAAAAVLLALFLLGNTEKLWQEIFWMALFLADAAVFCGICRRVCGSALKLGASIPILMLGMFALCPVFFTVNKLKVLQYLLPPYYYLNGVQRGFSGSYVIWMTGYALAGYVLLKIGGMLREK